jgi:hypothetical protein
MIVETVKSSLRIIVSGLIAQYPLGGVTWDYLQYVVGLKRLGHDVYYLEDTGLWPYNPHEGGVSRECSFNVEYLAKVMKQFGLENNWAYRFPWQSQWFGLDKTKREAIIESADLLINVSCSLERPWDYRKIRRLVYVDTDPVFTQVKLANGQAGFRKLVDAHDLHFSYGERLSEAGPETGHCWRPMRKPILLSEWRPSTPHRDVFTTVMNWTSFKDIIHNGKSYGQKDVEFDRFIDLPTLVSPTALEVAVNPAGKVRNTPWHLLLHKGWRLVNPADVCPDLDSYRHYVETSMAEWTVAKNGYVRGESGWFSGRSACYLAAGRPVVVQDTGFSSVIPTGQGVLSFRTLEEAAAGIRDVEDHYAQHAKAAREIAEAYFDSDKVLSRLLEESFKEIGSTGNAE